MSLLLRFIKKVMTVALCLSLWTIQVHIDRTELSQISGTGYATLVSVKLNPVHAQMEVMEQTAKSKTNKFVTYYLPMLVMLGIGVTSLMMFKGLVQKSPDMIVFLVGGLIYFINVFMAWGKEHKKFDELPDQINKNTSVETLRQQKQSVEEVLKMAKNRTKLQMAATGAFGVATIMAALAKTKEAALSSAENATRGAAISEISAACAKHPQLMKDPSLYSIEDGSNILATCQENAAKVAAGLAEVTKQRAITQECDNIARTPVPSGAYDAKCLSAHNSALAKLMEISEYVPSPTPIARTYPAVSYQVPQYNEEQKFQLEKNYEAKLKSLYSIFTPGFEKNNLFSENLMLPNTQISLSMEGPKALKEEALIGFQESFHFSSFFLAQAHAQAMTKEAANSYLQGRSSMGGEINNAINSLSKTTGYSMQGCQGVMGGACGGQAYQFYLSIKKVINNTKESICNSPNTVLLSDRELNQLAGMSLLEGEPKCQGDELDVTQTIMTRVREGYWPNDVQSVIWEPKQFQPAFDLSPNAITTKQGVISTLVRKRSFTPEAAEIRYNNYISDISNPSKMQNSIDHTNGYGFFKGKSQYGNRHAQDPLRAPGCNFFHPSTSNSSKPTNADIARRKAQAPTRILPKSSCQGAQGGSISGAANDVMRKLSSQGIRIPEYLKKFIIKKSEWVAGKSMIDKKKAITTVAAVTLHTYGAYLIANDKYNQNESKSKSSTIGGLNVNNEIKYRRNQLGNQLKNWSDNVGKFWNGLWRGGSYFQDSKNKSLLEKVLDLTLPKAYAAVPGIHPSGQQVVEKISKKTSKEMDHWLYNNTSRMILYGAVTAITAIILASTNKMIKNLEEDRDKLGKIIAIYDKNFSDGTATQLDENTTIPDAPEGQNLEVELENGSPEASVWPTNLNFKESKKGQLWQIIGEMIFPSANASGQKGFALPIRIPCLGKEKAGACQNLTKVVEKGLIPGLKYPQSILENTRYLLSFAKEVQGKSYLNEHAMNMIERVASNSELLLFGANYSKIQLNKALVKKFNMPPIDFERHENIFKQNMTNSVLEAIEESGLSNEEILKYLFNGSNSFRSRDLADRGQGGLKPAKVLKSKVKKIAIASVEQTKLVANHSHKLNYNEDYNEPDLTDFEVFRDVEMDKTKNLFKIISRRYLLIYQNKN